MNWRKIIFGGLSILLLSGLIWYFWGEQAVIKNIRGHVDSHLSQLPKYGVEVYDRQSHEHNETLRFRIVDAKRFSLYMKGLGIPLEPIDAQGLVGAEGEIVIIYLPDLLHPLRFVLIPLKLPRSLKDTQIAKTVSPLLKSRTLSWKFDFNRDFTQIKGHMKDIDTYLQTPSHTKLHLLLNGGKADAYLDERKLFSRIDKTFDKVRLSDEENQTLTIHTIRNNFKRIGTSLYDYLTQHTIKQIELQGKKGAIKLLGAYAQTYSKEVNDTLFGEINATVQSVEFSAGSQKATLEDLYLKIRIEGFDRNLTLSMMSEIEPSKQERYLDAILSKGAKIELIGFGAKKLHDANTTVEGFEIAGSLIFKKGFDPKALERNLPGALDKLEANASLVLSSDIFSKTLLLPQTALLLMLFPPEDYQEKKRYIFEIKGGKMRLNGRAL